jgi:cellulose synthase operon protein C
MTAALRTPAGRRLILVLVLAALAVRPAPTRAQPATTPTTPAAAPVWTPAELQELDELERDIDRYEKAGLEHQERIKQMLRREYDRRLTDLNDRYQKGIDSADKEFRRRHLDAIQMLKEFLAKYPNDPKWTPDAMFRLADLYLDQAKWEYDDKQAAGIGLDSVNPDEETDWDAPLANTGPDYSPSVDLWREIVRRFPDYRQVDAVVYALGFYQGEMRRTDESKQAYLGLVCRNKYDPLAPPAPVVADARAPLAAVPAMPTTFVDPYQGCEAMKKDNPELIDEAWMRIGEAHFDTRAPTREAKLRDLNLAIAAYKHVTASSESKFYDIALYKLAWAYYRSNQFMEGIRAFDDLVVFSDKREAAGGEKSDLRPEAVKYIAISFADPWETDVGSSGAVGDPVKSMERIDAFYKDRTTEPHIRDVYEEVGDVLKISAATPTSGEVPPETKVAYEMAIKAWRFTITKFPLHPRNPIVHKKIIDAYAFIGDQEKALAERRAFAELYKEGSEWYSANETNRDAIDFAARQGEMALLDAAREAQRTAQLDRRKYNTEKPPSPATRDSYLAKYKDAATLYTRYLAAYPTSPEVYQVTYDLAQCYYFGEQYLDAVPHFRWVRDHRDMGARFEDAAKGVYSSYELEIKKEIAEGKLVDPPIPTPEILAQNPQPQEVPQVYRDLQAAYEEYIQLLPDPTAPSKSLASAMISYRFLQLDEALGRFERLWDTYCASEEAMQAKDGMVVIYQARGDLEKSKEINTRFINKNCGNSEARKLAEAQNLSTDYRIALDLYKQAEATKNPQIYEKAGLAFYSIYKTSPTAYENRAEVLFNSALCYTAAGKPKTAIAIDQEFLAIPGFKTSKYYVEVLNRTALNYQNAFDYDRAVETFLEVVEVAGEPGRQGRDGFDLAQARLDAMWNAARLRDLDRVYYDRGRNDPGAATLYKRYAAAEVKDRVRASKAYFNAALVYEKAGSTRDMIKTFDEWRKIYGKDPGAGLYLVLSQYKTAKALEKARDRKGAEQYYNATIAAYDTSGERPGSEAAELAAEAQFWLAERVYNEKYVPYKVKWLGRITPKDPNNKKQVAAAEKAVNDTLDALGKAVGDAAGGYAKVARFESSWSLAALVRLGEISYGAYDKLISAPVPKEIEDLDKQFPDAGVLQAYLDQIEGFAAPNKDKGEQFWKQALDAARVKGVSTTWSKLAAEDLNKWIAADRYPVMRDELIDHEVNP